MRICENTYETFNIIVKIVYYVDFVTKKSSNS